MSITDFDRCTPSEFREISDAWMKEREEQRRNGWEMMRMVCLCSLQPHSSKKLNARDIMRFPWDEDKPEEKEHKDDVMSDEEHIKMSNLRFEEEKKRWGIV